jgi:hypothetical protein
MTTLFRDDHRERRLAEARRSRKQNVVWSAVLQPRGIEKQLKLGTHLLLPNKLGKVPGSKCPFECKLSV